MAIAVAGASSAMAESTQLCRQDMAVFNGGQYLGTGACPAAEAVNSVHLLSVGKAKLLDNEGGVLVECNVLFQSRTVGGLGTPQVIEGNFTYVNCGTCQVREALGSLAIIEVLREGHETAKVKGEAEISVSCLGIACVYNGEGLEGTAKGPLLANPARPNGEVFLQRQVVNPVEGICPEAELDIIMVPLTATYLAK